MASPECVSEPDLRAYLLGELPERIGRFVSAHLDRCPECEAMARRLDDQGDAVIESLRRRCAPVATPATPGCGVGETVSLTPALAVARPDRIGGYAVLDEVGRGGMAVVYKARQERPARVVALKVLLAGRHSDAERRARFSAEGDAIARLRHPHIVQIYEVGAHDGLPFLSLEFIDGGSLTQKLGGLPLPARQAAALLETLARAVDYAHSQGVVHRDLKPANVLLTEDGQPKISDFGLAKLERPELTATGAVLGTPGYMAPEQAAGDNGAVGPATDIYALGAIFYELLTGGPPFRAAMALDTLQQVRTQDPVPPSRLHPKLPRDLEIMCLKCLEKEPRKRYASAAALADDLRRFSAGQPILARATPAWERAWKWGRRRPVVAASGAVSVLAVVGLLVLWGYFTAQLRTQRDLVRENLNEANKQWHRAESNQEKTLEAVDRFLTRVGETHLVGVPRMEPVQHALLTDALEFFQSFLQEQDNPDPRLRQGAARAYHRTAKIKRLLSRPKDAAQDDQRAVVLLRQLVAEDPDEPSYRHDLAKSLHSLGEIDEALELKKRLVADHPEVTEYQRSLGVTYVTLGLRHRHKGQMADAESAYRTGLALLEPLVRDHPDVLDNKYRLAQLLNNLGALQYYSGNRELAVQTHVRVRNLYLDMLRMPRGAVHRKDLLVCYANLAETCQEIGQLAEAAATLEEALALMKQLIRESPNDLRMQGELARKHTQLAGVYSHMQLPSLKQPPKAARELQSALDILKGLVRTYPDDIDYRNQLAAVYIDLASLPEYPGHKSWAREGNLEAVAVLEPRLADYSDDVLYTTTFALACFNLAFCDTNNQELDVRLKWLARADKLLSENLNRIHHPPARLLLGRILATRAKILSAVNRHREALVDLDRAVALGSFEPLQLRCARAHTRCWLGDHAGAASDAQAVADQKPFVQDPGWYCQLAGVFAAVGRTVAGDEKLPPADRARLTAPFEDRAMEFLVRACQAGRLSGRAQLDELKSVEHLDRLRKRPDFQKWLREAENKVARNPGP